MKKVFHIVFHIFHYEYNINKINNQDFHIKFSTYKKYYFPFIYKIFINFLKVFHIKLNPLFLASSHIFSTGYPLFHIYCGKLCGKHCGKKFSTKLAKVFHRLSAGNPFTHQRSHISTIHNNNIYNNI